MIIYDIYDLPPPEAPPGKHSLAKVQLRCSSMQHGKNTEFKGELRHLLGCTRGTFGAMAGYETQLAACSQYNFSMDWFKGKLQENPMILMGKSMVSCKFSLKPIPWTFEHPKALKGRSPECLLVNYALIQFSGRWQQCPAVHNLQESWGLRLVNEWLFPQYGTVPSGYVKIAIEHGHL